MANRFTNPFPRYFLDSGTLNSGGKLNFYEAGSTTVRKNTFSDEALTIANENPVTLTASGVIPDIWLDGTYYVTLTDKNGEIIDDADNVGTVTEGTFAVWSSTTTYGSGSTNIVTGSDGNYYRSITSPNLGNDPVSSPSAWERIDFLPFYNSNVTYSQNDLVQDSGLIYASQANSNTGNALTAVASWLPLGGRSGTFTPAVEFGGASVGQTYGVQRGNYLLTGDWCIFSLWFNLNNKGTSTGNAKISGLPFNNAATDDFTYAGAVGLSLMASARTSPLFQVESGTNKLILRDDFGLLTNNEFSNSSVVAINGAYRIDT